MESADVVVVGARCAGSPLAATLARAGLRVCLLDKARLPSDTASTHIVWPRGTAALERLGVAERLWAAGAARIERLRLVYEDAGLDVDCTGPAAQAALSTGATTGLNARRTLLDTVLLDAAVAAGADVRLRCAVTGLRRDRDGRVVGVDTAGGPIAARVVVGADGRHSTIARLTGAREYATYPPGRLAAWGYFAGARDDRGRLRIGRLGERAFVACPTDGGLYIAGFVPSMSGSTAFLADRERAFDTGVRSWPELADVLDGAHRVGPLRTIADWHGYFRESAGPGWVLTGDAGNFKDPSAAQGITDALRQAETLADAIRRGLEHDGCADAQLREWWRWRDRDCYAMHWFADDLGAPGATRPVTAQLLRDVAGDEQAQLQFVQVLNRDLPPDRLLTLRRRARAAVRATRRRPAGFGDVVAEARGSLAAGRQRARLARALPA